jgi:hypothetical protein
MSTWRHTFVSRGRQVLKSSSLMNLISLQQSTSQSDTLPPEAKRGLTKALVLIGSACEDQVTVFFNSFF